jgi:8-oxo-dGTP pyrophosphatase MutT (NUDIX family)
MTGPIRIATALIDDGKGRIFLVRKRGTDSFMQAAGKIAEGEKPPEALLRELDEELGFAPRLEDIRFLGTFEAAAANEPGALIEAQAFHIQCRGQAFAVAAELEEGVWVEIADARMLPLAPLTRDHILPLAYDLQRLRTARHAEPQPST